MSETQKIELPSELREQIGIRPVRTWDRNSPFPVIPFDERVIVERITPDMYKVGSIIMPIDMNGKQNLGKVLSVGNRYELPGVSRTPIEELVAVGDTVIYGQFAGEEFLLEGETFYLLRRDEIKGKLRVFGDNH